MELSYLWGYTIMAETMRQLGKFKTLTPELNEAFQQWNMIAFKDGALSHKLKEIMAVAAAATTGCDFCLDLHSKGAKRAGATQEEVAEALMIATAAKAGSPFAHAANAMQAYNESTDDELFKKSYLMDAMALKSLAPDDFKAFFNFTGAVVKEGALSVKEKELITVAMTLITGCPYCIDTHVKNAKKAGATKEEVAETIFIASALNAGSAYTQSAKALKNFD